MLKFVTTFNPWDRYSRAYKGGHEMSSTTLDMRITSFWARKDQEFPELGLVADRMARTTKY